MGDFWRSINIFQSIRRDRMLSGDVRTDGIEPEPSHRELSLVPDAPEAKVVVGLDFGTANTGFAYSYKCSNGEDIHCFDDYAAMPKPYCKTKTALYYMESSEHPGGWRLESWGHPALLDLVQYQRAQSSWESRNKSGSVNTPMPVQGRFLTGFKLTLARKERSTLWPNGLTVDRAVTDYLRQIGGLVLATVQTSKKEIQWCITVPSIWDNSAKARMRQCMIEAGLVKGVTGSLHPLMIVLEPEAASYHCNKHLYNKLNCGDRVLVADIGGGTADLVMQKVLDVGSKYRVEEVTRSTGGLCGGQQVDKDFLIFLGNIIGPCMKEAIERINGLRWLLLECWEPLKITFNGSATPVNLRLPTQLSSLWEEYEREKGFKSRESYEEVDISCMDMERIFSSVVMQNVELIEAQLNQVESVKVLFVVGGFSASQYFMKKIREAFVTRVPHIFSPEYPGSTVCRGAVALAFRPESIVNRITRVTYGTRCQEVFEFGIDPSEYCDQEDGVPMCKNRFKIYVKKGTSVPVDHPITKTFRPAYATQTCMIFFLYSSTDEEPRYTVGNSVTEEGKIEVDISSALEKGKDREVELSLFFGRTSIEVKAEARNLADVRVQHINLPVKFY